MTQKLFGPFAQIISLDDTPDSGPISDDQLKIYSNAGILVKDGLIAAIDDFDLLNKNNSAQKNSAHNSNNQIVLPGFVDVHTHMLFSGTRANDYAMRVSGSSYQEILKNGGGIHSTVSLTRATSDDELLEDLKQRLKNHLKTGVTTIEVKSGYGLSVDEELRHLKIINACAKSFVGTVVPTCLAAHVMPKEFSDPQIYIDKIISELLPQIKDQNLSRRVDVFVEDGAFNEEIAEFYLLAARKLGFQIVVHADQFTTGSAKLAAKLNALSADHLEASTDTDLLALKTANVIPVVLPGSSIGLGVHFAPARRILDLGLPLVIASDFNPGSAPMGQLLLQACVLGAAQKLSLAETLAAISSRAARALGFMDRGNLKVGERADFLVYDTNDWRDVFWRQGSVHPNQVICGGSAC